MAGSRLILSSVFQIKFSCNRKFSVSKSATSPICQTLSPQYYANNSVLPNIRYN